jgi:hypothetical protein
MLMGKCLSTNVAGFGTTYDVISGDECPQRENIDSCRNEANGSIATRKSYKKMFKEVQVDTYC